jgi:hypothetical protein
MVKDLFYLCEIVQSNCRKAASLDQGIHNFTKGLANKKESWFPDGGFAGSEFFFLNLSYIFTLCKNATNFLHSIFFGGNFSLFK